MASLTPSPKMQFFDSNGNPLSGGKLYTYTAGGTSTPQATYTDYGGGTPHANPVVLDSRGEASVWLGTSLYYMVLKDSADAQIWTADNVGGEVTLSALAASGGSAMVGYLPVGTGAVATTVQTQLRTIQKNRIYITDAPYYGKDDGLTDNSLSVRAALLDLQAIGGGELLFPRKQTGVYKFSSLTGVAPFQCFSPIYSNITLVGIGNPIFKADSGLSDSNQWNFFILRSGSSCENVTIDGITFDFNGANNLTPNGVYRPCLAIWIIALSGTTGKNHTVTNCQFIDNPGSNSVGIVADAPVSGVNNMENVTITNNIFRNFGYAVNNSANMFQDDHSCIYAQAQRLRITGNYFIQDFTLNEAVSIGMSAIDFHSAYSDISNNICDNVHTFSSHQSNNVNTYDVSLTGNICHNTDRLFALYEGSGVVENITISGNTISPKFSNRNLHCIDMHTSLTSVVAYNVLIHGNNILYRSGPSTSGGGKTANAMKFGRVSNITVKNNLIQNSPGKAIDFSPTTPCRRAVIEDNQIYGYGIGEIATHLVGLTINTSGDGGAADSSFFVRNNIISNGTLATREAGIVINGAMDTIIIDNNEIIGAAKKCTTSGYSATTNFIRRGKLHKSSQLTFSAPGAVPGQVVQNATVSGAKMGDIASVSCPVSPAANKLLSANVVSTNTVGVSWTQVAGAGAGESAQYYQIVVDQMNTD